MVRKTYSAMGKSRRYGGPFGRYRGSVPRFGTRSKRLILPRTENTDTKMHKSKPEQDPPARKYHSGEKSDSQRDYLADSAKEIAEIDEKMGFKKFSSFEGTAEKLGWLVNMHPVRRRDKNSKKQKAAVDLYFLEQDGGLFKATVIYEPYFYVLCHDDPNALCSVENYLSNKYKSELLSVKREHKEDLSMPDHLALPKIQVLKLSFNNVQDLLSVRKSLCKFVDSRNIADPERQLERIEKMIYKSGEERNSVSDPVIYIKDIREYDIPYYIRTCIDLDIRVGTWYNVKPNGGSSQLVKQPSIIRRADPVVFAFDIETTKLPLKFPDSSIDSIMMISYMIDEMGYLITNREIVSEDIKPFEYTPKPEYEGHFKVYNEKNEKALLMRFFRSIKLSRPTVLVTYNGDYFDWPFIDDRAKRYGINMKKEIGFYKNSSSEYVSSYASHMDCLYWVRRDSYLPQGSQGLKAVTKAKLGYSPIEVDPEDMTRFSIEKPQILSQYSVSDALSTYYLYKKYIHPFIFSLCNIIPMSPDEVLRKGSGTLCEALLMVEAYKADVLIPNKHKETHLKFFDGHLLESETYVGGHVEALEAGIFREDLPMKFSLSKQTLQNLIDNPDDALKFGITVEGGYAMQDVLNYNEVKSSVVSMLEILRESPEITDTPLIYHLDVGAMYPNIILTNRLQPYAIVNESHSCNYKKGDKSCLRNIEWIWRGDYFPPKMNEYNMIVNQIKEEKFSCETENRQVFFGELSPELQSSKIKERLTIYSKKVYNKVRISKTCQKESSVCQRENPFYVNTVRNFRDKRYDYKASLKKAKEELSKTSEPLKINELNQLIVIYDSLQLAHKCILNSFYGYVMRKGARWYSMEMAGIVCLIGAKIIQMARSLIDGLGKPLELDTDGIWCTFPSKFPGKFTFELKNGKTFKIFYPCTIINKEIHDKFTNEQYQVMNEETKEYTTKSENSIFFEVDGPYRAMILPSSSKEDKLIKKRYVVFNKDGSLAEIKGFEVKRRGELKLIKIFQSQIFGVFLEGSTIEECYKTVSAVANQWLDVLYSKGAFLEDDELFDLISENRNMSKSFNEYGNQKSASISTAKRLAEFLGEQTVRLKGLNCKYVICNRPVGLPVSERAIPYAIFQAEEGIKRHFLHKWFGDNSVDVSNIRNLLDWSYYLERFGGIIQKIITVPAAMQNVENFVPRIPHPEWLKNKLRAMNSLKSSKISDVLMNAPKSTRKRPLDLQKVDLPEESIILSYKSPNENAKYSLEAYPSYSFWLKEIKLKWNTINKLKKSGKLAQIDAEKYGANPSSMSKDNSRLTSFKSQNYVLFHDQRRNLMECDWYILQIRATPTLGLFNMWIIVGGILQEIKLTTKRILYVNSVTTNIESLALKDDISFKRSQGMILPTSQAYNIYELQVPELFYEKNVATFSAINNHPEIEGIYESEVPLIVQTIISLGLIVKMKDSLADCSILSSGICTNDLEPQFSLEAGNFLSREINVMCIYVFLVKLNSGIYAGICLPEQDKINILIPKNVQKYSQKEIKSKICELEDAYGKLYFSLRSQMQEPTEYITYPLRSKVSVYYPKDDIDTIRNVDIIIDKCVQDKHKPRILVLQSSVSVEGIVIEEMESAKKLPLMQIPIHRDYKKCIFLEWEKNLTKYMLKHYLDLDRMIKEKVNISSFSHVPMCNLPDDHATFVTDIMFARRMKQSNVIIPWGDKSVKDKCDIRYPEVNMKGCYDTLCFDLRLSDLVLSPFFGSLPLKQFAEQKPVQKQEFSANGLMQHKINTATTSQQIPLDILKSVVLSWSNDVKRNKLYGAILLSNLYKWIFSRYSNMRQAYISEHIFTQMKAVFSHLLLEIERLGGKIIYATFERLVLCTKNIDFDRGYTSIKNVIENLKSNDLFSSMDFNLAKCWKFLLWLDPYDYGGVVYKENKKQSEIETFSCISYNLNKETRNTFREFIREFIEAQSIQRDIAIEKYKCMTNDTYDYTNNTYDYTKYIKEYINKTLKQKLLAKISSWKRSESHNTNSNLSYSLLANYLHEMITLDTTLISEADHLKSDIFRLVGFNEFGAQGTFVNPFKRIKINNFFCSLCGEYRKLYIHVDKESNLVLGDNLEEDIKPSWSCSECSTECDTELIEYELLELINHLLLSWHAQDLICQKCKYTKAEDLKEYCANCAGQVNPIMSKNSCMDELRALYAISKNLNMPILQEISQNFVKND